MRKLFSLLVAVLLTATVWAQSPEKMSYQAVIRDASSHLVTTPVGMRISILQTTSTGTAVYVETQTPTPNANGLVTIEIGGGTLVSGVFSTINWANGPYFIKTETDPAGGSTYSIAGTSQLLSVPYALYAKTAGGHYVGELFGGGIVVSVWKTAGVDHGLIASLADLNAGTNWSDISLTSGAISPIDGQFNTTLIMAQTPTTGAAKLCDDYSITDGTGTYSDWFLPAIWELKECYNSEYIVNIILVANGFQFNNYWSSTENDATTAWFMNFSTGITYSVGVKNNLPTNIGAVRAVRKF